MDVIDLAEADCAEALHARLERGPQVHVVAPVLPPPELGDCVHLGVRQGGAGEQVVARLALQEAIASSGHRAAVDGDGGPDPEAAVAEAVPREDHRLVERGRQAGGHGETLATSRRPVPG